MFQLAIIGGRKNRNKHECHRADKRKLMTKELQIENELISKLSELKYTYRKDIRDRHSLEQNFRKKFEALNRVHLSDGEFARLREEIINPDVFKSAKYLRSRNI
jgi:type I restriction enzyme R subunit